MKTLTIFDVSWYALRMVTTRPRASRTTQPAAGCCGDATMQADTVLAAPQADGLAGKLKALADSTRLRMLDLLARQTEPLCVCEINTLFSQHQPTISHHLRLLREAGLIAGEKRGVWSYYWATAEGKRCLALVQQLA